MALTICPDCGRSISDAAEACIQCGRPMRLSREATLAEIAEATRDIERANEVIIFINDCEHYDPGHGETIRLARERIDKNWTRITELRRSL